MNVHLNPVEARIVGSLMEKSMITPDQYPLSLNALVGACNQKSSREPVTTLSEADVTDALEGLQKRYLVREKSGFGSRVPRYHYRLYNDEIGDFRFSPAERALVCLLLLRGPQTPGELRSRAARMHEFAGTDAVERTLDDLMGYEQGPFVMRLPRQPGRREARYAELFTARAHSAASRPEPARAPQPAAAGVGSAPAGDRSVDAGGERLDRLEQRVAALEAAVAALMEARGGPR